MEFIHGENEIKVYDEQKEVIAEILFPQISEGVVDVSRTFVSNSLRGMGVAGKLMEEMVKNIQKTNRKAVPTCSYAVSWFEKHPEFASLLKK